MRPRSRNDAVCQNPECKYYKLETGKNIIKRGKNHAGHQQYQCLYCGKIFLETTNTLLFKNHLRKEEILKVIQCIMENRSIREIGKNTGHSKNAINILITKFILHASEVNYWLINQLHYQRIEALGFWLSMNEKKRMIDSDRKNMIQEQIQRFSIVKRREQ